MVPVTQQHANVVRTQVNVGANCVNGYGCLNAGGYYAQPQPVMMPSVVPTQAPASFYSNRTIVSGSASNSGVIMNYGAHASGGYGAVQQPAATGSFANLMSAEGAGASTQSSLQSSSYNATTTSQALTNASAAGKTTTTVSVTPVPGDLEESIFASSQNAYGTLNDDYASSMGSNTYVTNGYSTSGQAASSFVQGGSVQAFSQY